MSLLECDWKSRHESLNDPVIVAVLAASAAGIAAELPSVASTTKSSAPSGILRACSRERDLRNLVPPERRCDICPSLDSRSRDISLGGQSVGVRARLVSDRYGPEYAQYGRGTTARDAAREGVAQLRSAQSPSKFFMGKSVSKRGSAALLNKRGGPLESSDSKPQIYHLPG